MNTRPAAYRLLRPAVSPAVAPVLDPSQRAVVEHPGGPLLVLAGPGTGKTTTIVETVVDRVSRRGVAPERVLVLTFSRKAAGELRERITARLDQTTRQPLALTFHSYAWALLRRELALGGEPAPALLPAPEQLLEIRRMLRGEADDGGSRWPGRLRPALATAGFAAELRDFLLRAAERGLDGAELARLGAERDRDDWVAAGGFLDRYAARFDLSPVPAYDYAEIIRIAAALLAADPVRAREHGAYDLICVDEYQDTDPAQEALLRALASGGAELIAVGDPDQSIYGFRGADPGALARFADAFRAAGGEPADVLALRVCRRSGPALLAASRRVASRLPAPPATVPRSGWAPGPARPGTPRAAGHRELTAAGAAVGDVRILTASSASQEAAVVADVLRRAHLRDGMPWSSMAVLVRSVARQMPPLRRALASAGVPVTVAGDELPLEAEPGARPLLLLTRCALFPGVLDEDTATELLTGPLGGSDALGLRRLRRALRAQAAAGPAAAGPPSAGSAAGRPVPDRQTAGYPVAGEVVAEDAVAGDVVAGDVVAGDVVAGPPGTGAGGPGGVAAAPPDSPLADALRDPRELTLIDVPAAAAARTVAGLLRLARDTARHGSAHDVLWAVWEASGLAVAWQAASAAGGQRGAAADRDLDAVCALFDAAARFTDRLPPGSPRLFLESLRGQEIPGDTLARRAPSGDAVPILTAHRAKGLEWDVVVVAGVQEGIWPDLRARSSLLGRDDMVDAADGLSEPGADAAAAAMAAKLLTEERRLFYVAATRARRSLIVTAIAGDDSEERPSRFLAELAGDDITVEHLAGSGHRWLSLPALTADLRRAAADPARPPALREAAAAQLARLAAAGVRGAHPRQWYQLTTLSDTSALTLVPTHGAPRPPAGDGGVPDPPPVPLSPSAVESFTRCGLRWLLEKAVGAGGEDVIRHLGIVIHAAAALAATGADETAIGARVDEIWRHLDFGSTWYSDRQRELARDMVRKFLAWQRGNQRTLVAAEREFSARTGRAEIRGRVDRLERDSDGRAVVVDVKTGSTAPASAELDRHAQLGVYQLAVSLGAFERFGLTEPGGAELVQVGKASLTGAAKVQRQAALADDSQPGWVAELVELVASGMPGPLFDAKANATCDRCPVRSCCPVHPEGEQVTGDR